jgi:hypothetical protein
MGFTQLLTNEYHRIKKRYFLLLERAPFLKADIVTVICEPIA